MNEKVEVNDNPKNEGYLIADFMKDQFLTLRDEIKESKTRRFKIITSGIIGVPLISVLAEKSKAEWICLILPFFVIAIVLLEVAENNTIYRAGTYIKLHIERKINKLTGWETWLDEEEEEQQERETDYFINASFSIVFTVYYFGSVIAGLIWLYILISSLKLSWLEIYHHWVIVAFTSLGFLYVTFFAKVVKFYYENCKWRTRIVNDVPETTPK